MEVQLTCNPESEKAAREDFAKANPGVDVPLDASISGSASTGFTITPGGDPIKVGDQSYTGTFKMSGDGKVIKEASGLSDAGKTATDVKDFTPQPNGDFTAGSVGAMEVKSTDTNPPVQLTNARDVTMKSGKLCGGYAEAMLVGTDLHANVNDFCVVGNRVDVKHADEVRVKCADGGPGNGYTWSTAGVSDATFVVDGFVRLNSSTAQDLAVRDCAGNDVDVVLKGEPLSRVEFRKDGLEIKVEQANVTVRNGEFGVSQAFDDFVVQETADVTGSAKLTLDRLTKKVSYVDMNPTFMYEFRTGKGSTDFGLRAGDVPGRIFIRRSEAQGVPDEFLSCKGCGVMDLQSIL